MCQNTSLRVKMTSRQCGVHHAQYILLMAHHVTHANPDNN